MLTDDCTAPCVSPGWGPTHKCWIVHRALTACQWPLLAAWHYWHYKVSDPGPGPRYNSDSPGPTQGPGSLRCSAVSGPRAWHRMPPRAWLHHWRQYQHNIVANTGPKLLSMLHWPSSFTWMSLHYNSGSCLLQLHCPLITKFEDRYELFLICVSRQLFAAQFHISL